MNKEEFTLLENIKRLDNDMQKEVKVLKKHLVEVFQKKLK